MFLLYACIIRHGKGKPEYRRKLWSSCCIDLCKSYNFYNNLPPRQSLLYSLQKKQIKCILCMWQYWLPKKTSACQLLNLLGMHIYTFQVHLQYMFFNFSLYPAVNSSSSWAYLRKYLLPQTFLLCCKLGIIFDSDIPGSAVSRDCWLFSCSTSKIGALFPYVKAWSKAFISYPNPWFPDVVFPFSFILSCSENYFLGLILLLCHFVSAFLSWNWLPTSIKYTKYWSFSSFSMYSPHSIWSLFHYRLISPHLFFAHLLKFRTYFTCYFLRLKLLKSLCKSVFFKSRIM